MKVLVSGLQQLATNCEKLSGELAADAKPPSLDTSGWQSSAATAQNALEQLAEQVTRPGGVEWEGAAGEAAVAQAQADLMKVRPFTWSWDEVAVAATSGTRWRWPPGVGRAS